MRPDKGLRLHTEHRTVFTFYRYRSPRLKQRLVDNLHRSHRIIHDIINIFHQFHTSGKHLHRSLGNIPASQRYFGRRRRLITSFQIKLILLRFLFRIALGLIIQLLENILGSHAIIIDFLLQVRTERFKHRKHNPTPVRIYRHPFDIVETTIRNSIHLGIQIIQIQHGKQYLIVNIPGRQIIHLRTRFVVLVEHIQYKILRTEIVTSDVVHILHHQIPSRQIRTLHRTPQHLHYQGRRCRQCIGSQFTDGINFTPDSILIRHSEHLIRIQRLIQ